jgi:hypothetical protein
MCAWLNTTASIAAASNGKGWRLRLSGWSPPWISPQSSSSVRLSTVRIWQEPVTSPAAP